MFLYNYLYYIVTSNELLQLCKNLNKNINKKNTKKDLIDIILL